MARPRFHRLPVAQQQALLDAALEEFAGHGYGGASLNRIIAATGLSKGAMYYYFDGKEDLYADVIRRQLERLFEHSGPVPVPDAADPEGFWAAIEQTYMRLMVLMTETPETGVLLRDWLTGAASPALREAQRNAEQATLPWLEQTVAAGQRIGAIRTDLPADFLIAIALGMGQAMDTWLIIRPFAETELGEAIHALIDMMRRALSA
ncbi:TetR/AcrR family transcriptional regulator [Microbacterium rhizosphaerae]|uniref:TetR/AcrR family transcriptional regulator n=1 Tax=Microbacterium rhizosphaerae TaxID=1678237 RepID=A0ABZ0SLF6_9MICO|nr:TetR/AcrR family transcriptional regulator [Microbacterium rhizosphaerae]WPR89650.1 TetR/AcrR family transcriptional regulator [Microbacterium rhizosphaerae]